MKKQINVLKLTFLAAFVAALSVGCASSGYARHDADTDRGVGVSAGAEVGTENDMDMDAEADVDLDDGDVDVDVDDRQASAAGARSTVSALSFNPDTSGIQTKFPWYDWNIRAIETYTFAVPDADVEVSTRSDLPRFSVNLPPGSVFVEAAGGAGELRAGRVIQHSPNPR